MAEEDKVDARFLIGSKERNKIFELRKERKEDYEELEIKCREIIHKEYDMVDDRLTWYLNFEGFLFAGAGFAVADSTFLTIISVPGCLAGISVLFSVWQAKKAREKMQDIMKNNGKALYPLCGEMDDESTGMAILLMPKYFLPVLLTGAWMVVFYVQISRT